MLARQSFLVLPALKHRAFCTGVAEILELFVNIRTCGVVPGRPARKVRMTAAAVPVALDGFGVEVDLDPELLGQALHDVPAEPELVGRVDAAAGPDLDLPLAAHHLRVGARDGQACLEAREQHCFRELAAERVLAAHAALVRPLRLRLPVPRESERPGLFDFLLVFLLVFRLQIHDYVLLLDAEPRIFILTCVEYFLGKVSQIGPAWDGQIKVGLSLAHDEHMRRPPERIGDELDRFQKHF